jgi:hypothetical protein
MRVALLVVDGVEIVTMTVVVVAGTATNHMVDAMVAEMIVIVVTAVVTGTIMAMLLVESTVTPDLAKTDTAVEVMNDVEEATMTETVTTAVDVKTEVAEMLLLRLAMVIRLLVEMLESPMEVEATMMRDTPVVNINC